jgi:extracellular elastinolytic metalloproteinase
LRRRPFFHPKPRFKTFKDKTFFAAAVLNETEILDYGVKYTLGQLNLEASELNTTWSYTDTANVTHIYFKHLVNGIEVSNHHAAVHIKKNHVIAFSSSFNHDKSKLYKRNQEGFKISKKAAISIAVKEFKVNLRPHKPVELKYIELPNGVLSQAYVIQLKDSRNWLEVFVDASHGNQDESNQRSNCSCN